MAQRGEASILIVYTGYLERGLGVVQYIKQLRQTMERFGYGVQLLTLDSIPFPLRHLPHLIQYALDSLVPPMGRYYRLTACRQLFRPHVERALRRHPIKGVVFQDVYCATRLPVPAVAVLHALVSDNLQAQQVTEQRLAWLKHREARLVAGCPVQVVTVSEAYRASVSGDMERFAGLARDLPVIPLGVSVDAFPAQPARRPAHPLHLGFAGSVEARKNPSFLVQVLRLLCEGGVEADLTIIGDGPLMPELQQMARNAGVSERVHYCGRLAHELVPNVLQQFHVFLLPSLKESFSYALLEAKLAGALTIAPEGLDVPDEFCDWRLPLDPAAWAARLRDVARHCAENGGMDPGSPLQLREKYAAEANCRRVLDALGIWQADVKPPHVERNREGEQA